jgi:CRISPR-associated protein Csx10
MKAVTFAINLLEPLLATGIEGDPNAGVSQNYISGSVLRGAVIGLYLRDKNKKQMDLTDDERRLFFDGTVRFLNSYQLVITENGEVRSLPTPLAWQEEKDADNRNFRNFCVADRVGNYKNLGNPFFAFESGDFSTSNTILAVRPKRRLSVHINRSITGNTSGENDSQVFRYESIAEGTKFCGAFLSEDEDLLKRIESLIRDKKLNLGGSRTAGYGKAVFLDVKLNNDWNEPQVTRSLSIALGEIFSITLLSNAIVRDKNGQLQADLTAEQLGINALLNEEKTFKRSELVGGFNRKWGLPLPQQLSIKAGSVFTFTANERITTDKIIELHKIGIGERKLDGFGRIVVNLNNVNPIMDWKEEKKEEAFNPSIANDFAGQMAMRMLRQRMDSQLVKLINHSNIESGIKNSQISRLRLVVRQALRNGNQVSAVDDFFANLKKTATEQFQKAKISGERLDAWVKNRIAKQDSFGTAKEIALGGKIFNNDSLKLEYHLRLIDGVLAKAAKENKQ